MDKLKVDFIASRNVIAANVAMFHHGHRDVYRVIAGELRKLLCDRPHALLERLFPHTSLHPARLYRPGEDLSLVIMQIPAVIQSTENGPVILEIFQKHRAPIPLQEWLGQPLFNAQITVRELIKSVADKEGAHADPDYNDALIMGKTTHVGDHGQELLGLFIVGIGEYVLEMLDRLISGNPAVFPLQSKSGGQR